MRVKRSIRAAAVIVVVLALSMAGTAHAAVLLSDDFNAENGGAGALNYFGFTNWTVSNGSVDLCGNGFCDLLPGNGLYLDMDGSTGDAGKLTSIATFSLAPGLTYVLSFDLAGNQRGGSGDAVTVQVAMGSAFSEVFSLGTFDPFTTFTRSFTVSAPTIATISFEGSGGDNVGMFLDDVVFATPAPPGLALLGAALIAGALARGRRRRARSASGA